MEQNKSRKFKRATAIKLHIIDLLSGKFQKEEDFSYIQTEFGVPVSRVHLLGTIIEKWMPSKDIERTPQASLILDDGTETIRIKAWKEDVQKFEDFRKGDLVEIIGRVQEYEQETYINPEIIRKIINPNWELVRELEIVEYQKNLKSHQINQSVEIKPSTIPVKKEEYGKKNLIKDQIVELISQLDDSRGISLDDLKQKAAIPEADFQEALTELINEGTIYQPNPGKYKIL